MTSAHDWLRRLIDSPTLDTLSHRVQAGGRVPARGSLGSSTALLTGALALRTNRPILLVVPHLDDADDALDDLELFPLAGRPLDSERLGALEMLPGETSVSLELLAERLAVVAKLARARTDKAVAASLRPWVLVAPIQALMQSVPEPSSLDKLSISLSPGQNLPPTKLMDWLADAGYQRV
ncbi:MAG: hypothetical protein NTW19_06085, partial [Planctomycetota bacterium]|nr:hypothetical protein [Planctomycetota bacterium]